MRLECPKCGRVQAYNSMIFQRRRESGLTIICLTFQCEVDLIKEGISVKRGATDDQKRSRDQEKRVAQREGGKRQAGSGSVSGVKGDVRAIGKVRSECKFTRAASFRLKLIELLKIEREASGSELPVFDIEFQRGLVHRRYVVLPEWVYETLMHESGRRKQ